MKEWIRTIAAVLSVILQSIVLHYVIKYHPVTPPSVPTRTTEAVHARTKVFLGD